jgi:hypothetical protein
VCAGLAAAQGSSTIVGTVTDSSDASVPSARITVTQEGTGTTRSVVSDANGSFIIPALRPANYEVTVEVAGFKKYTQTKVTLQADQSLTVNVKLEVGETTTSIVVNEAAPQVDTYTPTLKQVIEEKRMVELPLNGRNAADLTTLVAGVVTDSGNGNDADQGGTKTFPAAVTISTNGSRQNQVSFLLDGGNNVDQFTNVNMPFPFPDALQEFSVQTANYSARYGQNAGGVVNIVTKAGTNQVHGSMFQFTRNAVLNARNFFQKDRDQLKRNQFGGTLGGPVVIPHVYNGKDRTFFFVGGQGTLIRNTFSTGSTYAPTDANMKGDFSSLLNANDPNNPLGSAHQLIDPTTGNPFAGNQIPTSSFDPASMKLASNYLPRVTGSGETYVPSRLGQNFYEVVARVDHNIGTKDHMFVRYFGDHFAQAPAYFDGNLLTNSAGSRIFSQSYSADEIHTFGPTLVNDFNFTFGRVFSHRGPAEKVPSVRDLGVNVYQPSQYVGIQAIGVGDYFWVGNTPPAEFIRNTFNFTDDFTWIHGRHNFTFGGQLTRGRVDINNYYLAPGIFNFTGDITGDALADFFLGRLRTFQQGNGQYGRNRATYAGLYAQDTIRATQHLSVDFGIRWDPWFPLKELKGRFVQFRPDLYAAGQRSTVYTNALPGELFPGDPGFVPNGLRRSLNQFAPRLGFAYDVSGNGKTSIRGGAGVFHDSRTVMTSNWEMLDNTPYSPQIYLVNPAGGFSNPLSGAASPFPAPFPPPKDAAFPTPVPVISNNPDGRFQVPTTYQWNLTIEHQLASDLLVRAGYVGSRTNHIRESVNLNPALYIPGSDLGPDDRRMFKDFSNIYIATQSVNSRYNSLQVTMEKRFSHNFQILGNYTWSKSIDDLPFAAGVTSVGGDSGFAALPWYFPNFHALDRGPSEFDRKHVLVVSGVWELPKLTTASRVVRGVMGGWQLSGIVGAKSGAPVTVMAGRDQSQTALGMDRAVDLGGQHYISGPCATAAPCVNWFDPKTFGMPAIGTFGNTAKGSLRGPGAFTQDLGMFKTFQLNERAKLQIRGEFFNVMNHTNLSNPSRNLGGSFGRITGAADPRISQLAMKLLF